MFHNLNHAIKFAPLMEQETETGLIFGVFLVV